MAITQTTDMDSSSTLAYELDVNYALRDEVLYTSSAIMAKKPSSLTHRGSSVRFWFATDLATATTALTEDTDVTAGKTEDSYIDVTITEYGAATGTTLKQKATNMLPYDSILSALNARQAADSYELLARTAMVTRSGAYANQIVWGGDAAADGDIVAADVLTAAMVKTTVARMRNAKVGTIGGKYLAMVSPYQSLDLREATGDTAWIAARNQQDLGGIVNGYIGDFGGCSFIESSRVAVVEDAGASTADVTAAHIVGQEALAMAWASAATGERPEARISPVVDKLQRFHHIGWYWFGGFKLFRPEASWELRTGTSLD